MYKSILNFKDTQIAIKQVKDFFQKELAAALNLMRVTAPLMVTPESGLNDRLNGTERPVQFDLLETGSDVQIVQSLAKWKRFALGKYGFEPGEGLYTDMNAIRRDEKADNIHSIYVDQWDWELVINKSDRNIDMLKDTVNKIYKALKATENYIRELHPELTAGMKGFSLPDEIAFITSQELEDMYPDKSGKERETLYTKEHGAVCLMQIGGKLRSGKPHDGRSPDYDDWSLNCDILLYYPVLDIALEISSMGIRVDEDSLADQLEKSGCNDRRELPFHKAILENRLPYTIGGGIGQSRLCMYFLGKLHIGEVHVSVWPAEQEAALNEQGCYLL